MDENTNTVVLDGENNPSDGAKTFTQEQLNAIVSKRLAEERAKSEAAFTEREQKLAKREFLLTAKERISKRGLPVELLDAINMSDAEAFNKSLDILQKSLKGLLRMSPEMETAIKKRLAADNAHPKAVGLLVSAFNAEDIQFDGKDITNWNTVSKAVKEQYADFFGDMVVEGINPANPPMNYCTSGDEASNIRRAMGIKK